MNAKQLKELAEQESKQAEVKENGTIVINPSDSKPQEIFETATYRKRHKLNDKRPQKRERVETEVVGTDIFMKTSVAGNSVNFSIADIRYTVPHIELSKYMEGLTNSIRVYKVQVKTPVSDVPAETNSS